MERLTGLDASFLYNETPAIHMHTLKVAILDPAPWELQPSQEMIQESIRDRLPFLPPFRRRLLEVPGGLYHPVWIEDPDFDLDYHVRWVTVPAPGGRAEMDRRIGEIASRPLDRRKPLWELYVLDGLADGKIGVLIKIHHAAADGVAATQLLANVMDVVADAPDPGPDPWRPDLVPSAWDLLIDALVERAKIFLHLPRLVRTTIHNVRRMRDERRGATSAPPKPILDVPNTSFNGSLTPHRAFSTSTLELSDVKRVKEAHGVTVNDVVLTIVGGALRAYLQERGEELDRSLVASVPVSTDQPDERGRLHGNRVSNLFTSLATDIDDPVERLHAVHEVTAASKQVQNLLGATMMQDWIDYTPPRPYAWAMKLVSDHNIADRFRPSINLIVSNVPGPREPLFSAGAKLTGIYSVGPLPEGVGLNITVWSYLGDLNVSVLSCRELLPEPHLVNLHMEEALDELLATVDALPGTDGDLISNRGQERVP